MRRPARSEGLVNTVNLGQSKAVLLWTLVLTFSCTAVLVDAFREEDAEPCLAIFRDRLTAN